jgi:hypothetical protein
METHNFCESLRYVILKKKRSAKVKSLILCHRQTEEETDYQRERRDLRTKKLTLPCKNT